MKQYLHDCKAVMEGSGVLNVNGKDMGQAVWNLLVSERDLRLYEAGMIAHRGWKVSNVKTYFGIRGSRQTILQNFYVMKQEFEKWLADISHEELFNIIYARGEEE